MKKIHVSCLNDEGQSIYDYATKHHLGIEILFFSDHYDFNEDAIKKIKNVVKPYDSIAIHGPYMDLYPQAIDPDIKKVNKTRFVNAYGQAKSINAEHMILHSGFIPVVDHPVVWVKSSHEFWTTLLDNLDDDFNIYIENVFEKTPFLLKELIQKINKRNLKICLDIGHVHLHSELPITQWIEFLGDDIGYVHLHNNDGTIDSHRGITNGTIPIEEVLISLEKHAPGAIWNLETHIDETISSLEYLKSLGYIH